VDHGDNLDAVVLQTVEDPIGSLEYLAYSAALTFRGQPP